jgi:hypothetical protein
VFKRFFTVEARSFTVSTGQMELNRAKDMDGIMKADRQYCICRTNKVDRIIYRTKKADRIIQYQDFSIFKRIFTVCARPFTVTYSTRDSAPA